MKNMLVNLTAQEETEPFVPDLVIFNAGGFPANRYVEGMTSSCSVDLHLGRYSKRFGRTCETRSESQPAICAARRPLIQWESAFRVRTGSEMVILGTQYAGEMKKGILTLMMYRMPLQGQLCLHSSANEDDEGNVRETSPLFGAGARMRMRACAWRVHVRGCTETGSRL